MTLCDAVNDFKNKITPDCPDTRYCSFAPPEETAGVIDLSPAGDGSRGIAFLADRIVIKLGADVWEVSYRDILVTEIIPSYETPFEDELIIASPSNEIRISDCGLNKFFLRQLISASCRISNTMSQIEREALSEQLASAALNRTAGQPDPENEKPPLNQASTISEPAPLGTAAAVQEIAAAKKAALAEAQHTSAVEITEEKIEWLSGKRVSSPRTASEVQPVNTASAVPVLQPENAAPAVLVSKPENTAPPDPELALNDEKIEDMSRDQAMSYLLESIAEINSAPAEQPVPASAETEAPEPPVQQPEPQPFFQPEQPAPESAEPEPAAPALTREPESDDIYIQASRKIREMCEDGRLTMEQVNTAVKEQLVSASEQYSGLDVENAPLPPAVKRRAMQLSAAADRLPEYFSLGEDIAARVMFFMLYQMLSYTDRIVQSGETKQTLNYFFVRFGAAGIILSMLDAEN